MASITPIKKNKCIIGYKLRAFLGYDENGRQRSRSKAWYPAEPLTPKKMEKTAKRLAEEFEQSERAALTTPTVVHAESTPSHDTGVTLSQFIADVFMPNAIIEKNCKRNTIEYYQNMNKNTMERLGNRDIQSIEAQDLRDYLTYLRTEYRIQKGNKPLSPTTIAKYYRHLKQIFSAAFREGYITNNPMLYVPAPPRTKKPVEALTQAEEQLYTDNLKHEAIDFRAFSLLALQAGLRRGEALGLTWRYVDFDNRLLHVRQNATESKGGVHVDTPKTATSIRTVPLTPYLYETLKELYGDTQHSQDEYLLHAGDDLFTPHSPSHYSEMTREYGAKIGVSHVTPHILRHTFGTHLNQSGVDVKTIQTVMGHSDAATTLNYYVRGNLEHSAAELNRVFGYREDATA